MSEWIEWNGGRCPVGDDVIIDVRYGFGREEYSVRAGDACFWAHDVRPEAYIIAFRVVEYPR